jgi:hypothetical protein
VVGCLRIISGSLKNLWMQLAPSVEEMSAQTQMSVGA